MLSTHFFSYALVCLAAAPQLAAQNKILVNDPDDRLTTVPTNWWTYSHQSVQDISNTVSAKNARIVDISVDQTAPTPAFTVTYVENSGPYFKAWAWYAGLDAAGLANALTTNQARLTSLKALDAGGGRVVFVAVMIANSGKDTKNSFYYTDVTADQIASALASNSARLADISSYLSGGKLHYAVVMNATASSDAQSWWYADTPAGQIVSLANSNNARLIALDRIPSDGNYNAIMVDCSAGCPAWSWNVDQTPSQMNDQATANGARVIGNISYSGCGGQCSAFVLVDNSLPPLDSSNPITLRVGQLLRAGGINGVQGLYLKQVGGPVLANLMESFVYEPASSIKVLAHLYAMTQVQNGAAALTNSVQQYTNGPTSCPDPATPGGTEPLSTALQEMMWHSDNARTREITDTFGDPSINAFALSIGMPNSRINHIIGCAGPVPDQFTLVDAASLYENVANGTLLTGTNQATFYSLMAGKAEFQAEGFDFTHLWDTDVPAMIAQAAPNATPAQRQAWQNQMNLAYKAGSYIICGSSCGQVTEYYSITGWAEIPFCSGGTTTLQDYVFGIYLHGGTDNSYTTDKATLTVNNFLAAKGELLREQITAGLKSCGLAQ
jgi:hypothetical protein